MRSARQRPSRTGDSRAPVSAASPAPQGAETADLTPVTLQVSFAPGDLGHAGAVLPHQLRTWGRQVDEILCVLDLRSPPAAAADADTWGDSGRRLVELVGSSLSEDVGGRLCVVDYAAPAARAVSDFFFGGRPVPAKDFRGGPFYAYFQALLLARHELVLHLDSDMLFGGGSQAWLSEAVALLAARPEVAACRPLPGPPAPDGGLRDQTAERDSAAAALAYRFETFTTRSFLVDRGRLAERLTPIALRRHRPVRPVGRLERLPDLLGHAPLVRRARPVLSLDAYDLPERLIGDAMRRAGQYRLDLLGEAPGMWSLHPTARTPRFYDALPHLIARVERADVTEEQLGRYDLHASMLG